MKLGLTSGIVWFFNILSAKILIYNLALYWIKLTFRQKTQMPMSAIETPKTQKFCLSQLEPLILVI